ncbi:unnamed protein product [Soboliphyme baturini]|uniref:HP domain-containing protein n=1 Tax=Soboliphyme baturini TaxID=241478 RepID=A0A183IWG5_9BILA|nr:unnamed protein product [Soboliphyme baturini]
MYLLPEPNMGYLKQPVSPHPPQTPQFHTPQGKEVKIRRSRISMFKSGMQKLGEYLAHSETLEESTVRPRSPAMNNEEPIELSHYPGAYVPAPNKIPAIERDDFPAPPFPYAVDEYKRRLSSTSPTAEDEEEVVDSSKMEKGEQELMKFQDECSIAKVVVQQLEEHMRKMKIPSHFDPRSASRTPSAKKIPYMKCRYESPVNASPSRYLNRPRPWEWWDKGRCATATIPYAQVPKPGYGLTPKAATLPTTNFSSYYDFVDFNTTLTSEYSERSGVTSPTFSYYERYQPAYEPCVLRSSLPDMSKPLQTYTYSQLTIDNKKLPDDVDRCHLERHLSRTEFESLFGMTPIEFYKLPDWKRINIKRKMKLF